MYQNCRILYQKETSPGIFVMTLDTGDMAKSSKPGQFVMIKCWEGSEPFLMRPISINSVDRNNGTMTLLYAVKGIGTELLSKLQEGDSADVLGPVGSTFPLVQGASRVALIGRGIGIAPLLLLAQDYKAMGTELYVYLSAKQEEHLFNREAFEELGAVLRTTTDTNYVITDDMARDCEELGGFDAAYSCGSNRLAKGMKEVHIAYEFPAYVSLEQHMACGIGACKGCVCKAKNPATGEEYYPRVCKEGPVFAVDEIY